MNIVLTWTNLNTGTFTTKVYRGTAPLDRANLTNPLVTLTAGESTWTDTTAVRGTQYYYVLESSNANDKESTINIPVQALPRRGPGPAEVKLGDYNLGWYGTLTATEFITSGDLANAVGLTSGTQSNVAPSWQKFARKGKTLYVPTVPLYHGLSWKVLYDLGLVFGVDGPGPYNAGADVQQSKKVVINGETYRVRLMTGFSDVLTEFPSSSATVTEPMETNLNEWNDLIYPLSYLTPDVQRIANYSQLTPAQLGMSSTMNSCLVQERVSAATNSSAVARGTAGNTGVRATIAQRIAVGQTALSYHWRPVLELIE